MSVNSLFYLCLVSVVSATEYSQRFIMSDTITTIRCDTPGSDSGPSSGSGIGHDSGLGFDETSYGVAVLEKLREQRDAQRFCDITIRIDGMNFSAHRAVLAACSPYFETLLDGSRIVRQTVVVASRPGGYSAFSVVLQFMYTGITSLTDSTVLDVMKFSQRFCMTQLRDRCIEFLQQHMAPSNCFRTKELALGLGLTGLVRIVDSYIVANAVDIADAESSVELSHAHLEELIGRSMPLSEIDRVRLISRWTEHKEGRRKRMPTLVTTYVQWQKVGPMELCTFLRGCVEKSSCGTALPSDWCLYRVLQSLKDSCLLPDIYFERLGELRDSCSVDYSMQSIDGYMTNGSVSTSDDNDVMVELEDTAEDLDTAEHETVLQSVTDKVASSCTSHQEISTTTSQEHLDTEKALDATMNAEKHVTSDLSPLSHNDGCVATCSSNRQQKVHRQKRKRVSSQRKQHRANKEVAADSQQDAVDSAINVAEPVSREPSATCNNEGNQKSARKNVKKRKTNGLRNIRCQECQFKAQTVDKLRNHMRTAHRDRQTFCCSLCSFKACWNREYYKHMATHFAGPPYRCDSCFFTTERIRLLVVHLMDHTDSRPYSCRTCGIRFKMKNNLVAHERCHSGIFAFVALLHVLSLVHTGDNRQSRLLLKLATNRQQSRLLLKLATNRQQRRLIEIDSLSQSTLSPARSTLLLIWSTLSPVCTGQSDTVDFPQSRLSTKSTVLFNFVAMPVCTVLYTVVYRHQDSLSESVTKLMEVCK